MTEETKMLIVVLITLGTIALGLHLMGVLDQPAAFTSNIPSNQPQRLYH